MNHDDEEEADGTNTATLQVQVKKYEGMIKAFKNQITLIRHSNEQIIQNLKEEIKDVMDAGIQTEKELILQVQRLQMENETFHAKQKMGSLSSTAMEFQTKLDQLQQEHIKVQKEIKIERLQSRDTITHLRQEKTRLAEMLERMQSDVLVLRSSAETTQSMVQIQQDRQESIQVLERVAVLWDKADEAIQGLESIMEKLQPSNPNDQTENNQAPEGRTTPTSNKENDTKTALSTLETAALVHGQVKLALMLIELKLRNGLMALKNDAAELGAVSVSDPVLVQSMQTIQEESMSAIVKVQDSLKLQMETLEDKSLVETKEVKENLASRMKDLKMMQARQKELEREVAKMSVEELGTLAQTTTHTEQDKSVQLFVSRKILERLQTEVLQVVARVKEKNETIGRLQTMIDEHKAREKTLMEELQRMTKDRADHGGSSRSSFRPTTTTILRAAGENHGHDSSHGEYEEEELLEEVVEEDLDEEIILEEEEEEEVTEFLEEEEEVLETSSLS
jgi:hypothetical protein